MSVKCGNCKGTHASASDVRACYGVPAKVYVDQSGQPYKLVVEADGTEQVAPVAKAAHMGQAATAKQIAFAIKLCAERPMWASVNNYHADAIPGFTKAMVSDIISQALALPKEEGATAPAATGYVAEAKRGDVHVVDGTYYRIHMAQKSGKPYACRATIVGTAVWAEDGKLVRPADIEWFYMAGFINELSEATKATADQAAAFGKLVGRCCFCSHAIDTPESTAVGYGPVCASKYGLPWGSTVTAAAV